MSLLNIRMHTYTVKKVKQRCIEYLLCAFHQGNQGHHAEWYKTANRNKQNNSNWKFILRINYSKITGKEPSTCPATKHAIPVMHSDSLQHLPWQLFQSWNASNQYEFHHWKTELDHHKETWKRESHCTNENSMSETSQFTLKKRISKC